MDIEEVLEIQEQHYALNKKKNELEETNEKYKLIISLGDDILKNIVEIFPQPRSKMDNPETIKTQLEKLKNKFDSLVTEDLEKKLKKAAELQIAAELEKERLELNKLYTPAEEVEALISDLDLKLRASLEERISAIISQVKIKNKIKDIEDEIKGLREEHEKEKQKVLEQLNVKRKNIIAALSEVVQQGISKDKTSEIESGGLDQLILISNLLDSLNLKRNELEGDLTITKSQLIQQTVRSEEIDAEILQHCETKKEYESLKTKVETEFNDKERHLEDTKKELSFIENKYGKTNELHLACSLDLNSAIQKLGEEDKKLQKLSSLKDIDLQLNHLQQQLLEVDIKYFNNNIDGEEAGLNVQELKQEIDNTIQILLRKEEGNYNKQIEEECKKIEEECEKFMLWRESFIQAVLDNLSQVNQNEEEITAEVLSQLKSKKTKLENIHQEKVINYNKEFNSISQRKNQIEQQLIVLKHEMEDLAEEIKRLEFEKKDYCKMIEEDQETIKKSSETIEQVVSQLEINDLQLNELKKKQEDARVEVEKLKKKELNINKALIGVHENIEKYQEESASIKVLQETQQTNEERKEANIKQLEQSLSKEKGELETEEKEMELVKKKMEYDLMQISSSIAHQGVLLIQRQREDSKEQSRAFSVEKGEEEWLSTDHQRNNFLIPQPHDSSRKEGRIKSEAQTVWRSTGEKSGEKTLNYKQITDWRAQN